MGKFVPEPWTKIYNNDARSTPDYEYQVWQTQSGGWLITSRAISCMAVKCQPSSMVIHQGGVDCPHSWVYNPKPFATLAEAKAVVDNFVNEHANQENRRRAGTGTAANVGVRAPIK